MWSKHKISQRYRKLVEEKKGEEIELIKVDEVKEWEVEKF